ncbi:hypothetical protein HPB47_009138 [Ixodes persulcatus]|uniref:Uncharacterized protein n=1 Tax=Ixodes persulcatus TaxID=34615 RepID=A0AC60P2T0_IXOPE|nr:hypothetical protein HPB47_009138 [Ixodes persulcatus]
MGTGRPRSERRNNVVTHGLTVAETPVVGQTAPHPEEQTRVSDKNIMKATSDYEGDNLQEYATAEGLQKGMNSEAGQTKKRPLEHASPTAPADAANGRTLPWHISA